MKPNQVKPRQRVLIEGRPATVLGVSVGHGGRNATKTAVRVEFDDPTPEEAEFPALFNVYPPSALTEV